MSLRNFPIKESGKPSRNKIEIAPRDGQTYDRLCKQIDELNKRVATLENTIKKLEPETRKDTMKDRCTQTNSFPMNRSFVKQKSLNIKLVDMNSQENDRTPKSSQTNKDSKPMAVSSPSTKSPPKAAPVSTSPIIHRYQKPQSPLLTTTSQVEPFISRNNLASVAKTPTIQNGKGAGETSSKEQTSPVKSFAKRYEELTRSETNLNRLKSQSATDVITLHFDKRKTNQETKKLTLVPQNKDLLSSSLSPPPRVKTEVKNSNVPVTVAVTPPQPSSPPSKPSPLDNGPPAAPPLPQSETPTRNASRNSEMNGPSNEAVIKPQNRSTEAANAPVEQGYDALMEQLKQFADKGFPFKRQITKQPNLKSNTWNYSKN